MTNETTKRCIERAIMKNNRMYRSTYTALMMGLSLIHINGAHPHQLHIGDSAPTFTAVIDNNTRHFWHDFRGRWVVFFSYPQDFTPVCTSEVTLIDRLLPEFERRNAQVVGISVDSATSHADWRDELKLRFPLITDTDKKIAPLFDMIHPAESANQTVRSVVIIDPAGKIRSIMHYPLSMGRNIDEILRQLDALQKSDETGDLTPANWKPGDDTLKKSTTNGGKDHATKIALPCPLSPAAAAMHD